MPVQTFGPLIFGLRQAAGESQRELGEALGGYDKSTVHGWEKKGRMPPLPALVRLARHYQVEFSVGPHGVSLAYLNARAA